RLHSLHALDLVPLRFPVLRLPAARHDAAPAAKAAPPPLVFPKPAAASAAASAAAKPVAKKTTRTVRVPVVKDNRDLTPLAAPITNAQQSTAAPAPEPQIVTSVVGAEPASFGAAAAVPGEPPVVVSSVGVEPPGFGAADATATAATTAPATAPAAGSGDAAS